LNGFIYFLQLGPYVKIGFSRRPIDRAHEVTASHPEAKLMGCIPARQRQERILHSQFAHLRSKGEWFRADEEIERLIKTSRPPPRAKPPLHPTVTKFLASINAFMALRGMTQSKFGRSAVGDPLFVFEVCNGRAPTLRTVERVEKFMAGANNPPA
jgi:hypothetical protein